LTPLIVKIPDASGAAKFKLFQESIFEGSQAAAKDEEDCQTTDQVETEV
jgi:hypothetical protein